MNGQTLKNEERFDDRKLGHAAISRRLVRLRIDLAASDLVLSAGSSLRLRVYHVWIISEVYYIEFGR